MVYEKGIRNNFRRDMFRQSKIYVDWGFCLFMPFGSETIKHIKFHFIKLQELWIEVEIWNWKRKILIYSIFFEMYGRI
jgi:hypothetical protein